MGLCWLHISDIHFQGKDDWRAERPRDQLLAYLEGKFVAGELSYPDLIFCTGDIAFGETGSEGLASQYQRAKVFFEKLRSVCKLPVTRLFVVPGNHDVNRREINKDAQSTLVQMAGKSAGHVAEINDRLANKDKAFQDAMQRLSAYQQFIADYLPHQRDDTGRCHYASTVAVNGLTVGIAGFNSAWSCAGAEDDRNIWIGAAWQLNQAERLLRNADVRIGLMHHPVDWLCQAERDELDERVLNEFDFWLGGHTHKKWVTPMETHMVLAAGAVGASNEQEFGVNLVSIPDAGENDKAAVHLHGYKNGWMIAPVPGHAAYGIWRSTLPNRLRGKFAATVSVPAPAGGLQALEGSAASDHADDPRQGEQADDASRIAATIAALQALLGKAQLPELLAEAFDEVTGLPEALATALQQPNKPRAQIAEDSFDQILKLARQLKTLADAGAGAAIWAAARKNQVRMQLLNAAQPVILLGARLRQRLPLQAGKSSCAVLNEISVSVLSREEIAAHIEAEFHPGKPVQLRDPHLFASTSVEMGTLDADETRGPIAALLKQLYKSLYPAWEVPRVLTHEHVAEIEGEFSQFKKDGKQVLLTLRRDASDSYLTDAVITAIARFHVDVIEILGADGPLAVFDYADGRWQATLKTLYRELQPFNL